MSAGVDGRHRGLPAAAFAALTAACLALAVAALATPRGAFDAAFAVHGEWPAEVGALLVAPRLALEAISAAELTSGLLGDGIDLGRWRGAQSRLGLPPLETEVARRIPALWRLRVEHSAAALDVRYEIVALNGRAGRLSHVDHPRAEIGARAEPLPVEVIGRDGDTAVLEGGMTLTLAIDETRFAGSYAGTLTITLHQL